VIHCRVINAPIGVGLDVARKAKVSEVLLNVTALEALYQHLESCRQELALGANLLSNLRHIRNFAPDDRRKPIFEEGAQDWSRKFRDFHIQKRSLPPIPKFPEESVFHEAESRWQQARQAELMDRYRPASGSKQNK
jgi:hypothetical protein